MLPNGPFPQKKAFCRFGSMSPYPGDVALRFTVRPCQVDSLPCTSLHLQVACHCGRLVVKPEQKKEKMFGVWVCQIGTTPIWLGLT